MSRSPWRDALDGQITILRELRRESSTIYLARSANIERLQNIYPDPQKRALIQARFGSTLAQAIEKLVREAEPVYLGHDIGEALDRKIDRVASHPRDTPLPKDLSILKRPLEAAMLPIPAGVIWFPGRGIRLIDVPVESGGTEVYVQALYFGDAVSVTMQPDAIGNLRIDATSRDTDKPMTGMGLMFFLHARASGFLHLTKDFGDHLVPVLTNEWVFGQTLDQFLTDYRQSIQAIQAIQAIDVEHESTEILTAAMGAYLLFLFEMMLQRITLWGGVGLNRTEQRDAEREKVRPRVQVVTWRKANYQYPEGHIPVPKNWSCRWSIREHYRHYKSGKAVKIQSYIKGPPDKPYRGPSQRANIVKR